jgi:hypothetical protein
VNEGGSMLESDAVQPAAHASENVRVVEQLDVAD